MNATKDKNDKQHATNAKSDEQHATCNEQQKWQA